MSRVPVVYRVTLVPLLGGPPPAIRLRGALKCLQRLHRLRCEAVEEVRVAEPEPQGEAPAARQGAIE